MNENSGVCAVILAAGQSSRFPGNKLLYKIAGKPVLSHIIESVMASAVQAAAIVVPDNEIFKSLIPAGFQTLINELRSRGMSTSIRAGIDYFKNTAMAVMLVAADEPLVGSDILDGLIEQYHTNPHSIICCSVSGIPRNPMIFPAEFFEDLLRLEGDNGGKNVAITNMDRLVKLEVASDRLIDVDSPEDLRKISEILGENKQ
ncbi:MAG: nucleotidyltransferase family protein [Thermoplasmataceae archaeon]